MIATLNIVLAMKPLDGNFAENVLRHGAGALCIDRCRVAGEKPIFKNTDGTEGLFGLGSRTQVGVSVEGRFPTNVVLGHSAGCQCVGHKKVKGNDRPGHGDKTTASDGVTGWGANKMHSETRHSGEDGLETVEDWRCGRGCPVRVLAEQVPDTTQPSWRKAQPDRAFDDSIFPKPEINRDERGYGDVGSVARFFKQVGELELEDVK